MADWSAQQYLKFEDERTRPSRDLLAQIPLLEPRKIVDIGCGPGNSTELLVKRWPGATVIGIDTSADMLRQARERLPKQTFVEANVAHWVPPDGTDLLFANAIFQWVPGHLKQLQRLLGGLPAGGVLAVQIPDSLEEPAHLLMREVARRGAVEQAACREGARARRTAAAGRLLRRARARSARASKSGTRSTTTCSTTPPAVVEWVKGTGLRPFLELLETPERKQYLAEYTARVASAYLPQADGKVLFRFPRIFIVAVK